MKKSFADWQLNRHEQGELRRSYFRRHGILLARLGVALPFAGTKSAAFWLTFRCYGSERHDFIRLSAILRGRQHFQASNYY